MTLLTRLLWGFVLAIAPLQLSAQQPQGDSVQLACLLPAKSAAEVELKYQSCSTIIERKDQPPMLRSFAFVERGWVELGRNNFSKAIGDFNSSLALNADFDNALIGRAIAFLNSRQSERAIPDYDRLIAKYPTNDRLYVGRGDAYNNLKQYNKGIADFDRAMELNPKNDEAMNDRAWAMARQGKHADAIRGYDTALTVTKTRHGMILSNRCEVKAMARDIDGALADCDTALKLDPANATYRGTRAFANLSGQRFVDAIADYNAAFASDPTDPFTLFGRGIARLQLGQTADGRDDMAAALKLRPTVREDMAELGISVPASP